MLCELAVRMAGEFLEQIHAFRSEAFESAQKGLVRRGRGIVQQLDESVTLGCGELVLIHGGQPKRKPARGNRETFPKSAIVLEMGEKAFANAVQERAP